MSVVGYNDIPIVSHLPTPLTTVRIPFDQIAARALELVIEGGGDQADVIFRAAPTLIPRRSTARPAGA
ncbi:MAG: substrate-binding domain-containing protein [Brevundimonas sp.]